MSYWRLMKTAERGLTLAKIFNLREGFTKEEDRLPKRMALSQTRGNLKGVVVDPQKLAEAQELYFQMLGGDPEGSRRGAGWWSWESNGQTATSRAAEGFCEAMREKDDSISITFRSFVLPPDPKDGFQLGQPLSLRVSPGTQVGRLMGQIFAERVNQIGMVVINGRVAERSMALAEGDRVDVHELLGGG